MEPDDLHRIDDRLVDLEVRSSYADDLLERLNDVIVQQQRQIDLLILEVTRLKAQGAGAEAPAARSLRDELPPHY
jgi:SlyX protein